MGKTRNTAIEPDIDAALDFHPHMDADPYVKLWAAVFSRAVRDYTRALAHGKGHDDLAIRWFRCDAVVPGSFVWLCDLFQMDPSKVRADLNDNWPRLLESGQGRKQP